MSQALFAVAAPDAGLAKILTLFLYCCGAAWFLWRLYLWHRRELAAIDERYDAAVADLWAVGCAQEPEVARLAQQMMILRRAGCPPSEIDAARSQYRKAAEAPLDSAGPNRP
jgi:hypothetical protein